MELIRRKLFAYEGDTELVPPLGLLTKNTILKILEQVHLG
jgi:hypothetical protein